MKYLACLLPILLLFSFTACATAPSAMQGAALSIGVSKLIAADAAKAQRVMDYVSTIRSNLGTTDNIETSAAIMGVINSNVPWSDLDADETVLAAALLELLREKFDKLEGSTNVVATRQVLDIVERVALRYIR